ncbi:MAG: hypothetical protein QOG64_786 [Acidimicrobiaceae bacterium]|nr:hypothetical protein [Acidimicrobiaceae bacterium]
MTEVPEHLLRRSQERREALGLSGPSDGGEGGGGSAAAPAGEPSGPTAAPASEAVARQPAAAATPAVVTEPEPEPTYIAKPDTTRSKNPLWVMPVLVGFPLWVIFYVGAFSPPKKAGPVDPLVLGAQIYKSAGCSGCHGAAGEGGVGPKLTGGEAVKTFPTEADQVSWVKTGSGPFTGQKYGDPSRPGGQHGPATGAMPAFGSQLSQAQIDAVVKYEREKL